MNRYSVFTIALAAIAVLAGPAAAQLSRGPMQFSSDASSLIPAPSCTQSLSGNVEILQDRTRLRADRVETFAPARSGSCGRINRLVAAGGVFYVTPDQSVRANRAEYDLDRQVAVFTGDVIAVQGEDVSTADRMEINLETDAVTMSGNVRGVVFPDESEAP